MTTLGPVLLFVVLLYVVTFLIGWRLAKSERLSPALLIRTRRRLTDPITARIQRRLDGAKLESMKNGRWFSLWLVISINNLVLVAGVSRILYGVLLIVPVYLTVRTGLGHGIFRAQSLHPRGGLKWLAILEFGAYLLATALGMNAGLRLLFHGMAGFRLALYQCAVGFIVVSAMVLVAAALEVGILRTAAASVRLPPDLDIETFRAKALGALQKRP